MKILRAPPERHARGDCAGAQSAPRASLEAPSPESIWSGAADEDSDLAGASSQLKLRVTMSLKSADSPVCAAMRCNVASARAWRLGSSERHERKAESSRAAI
jgi:hypothetical protein